MFILDIKDEVEKGDPKRLKSIKLEPNSGALLYFVSDSEHYILWLYGDKLVDISPDLIVFKVLGHITCAQHHLHRQASAGTR